MTFLRITKSHFGRKITKKEKRFSPHLHSEERDACEQVYCGLEVLQLFWAGRGEVVAIHGEVDAQRVVKRVQQANKLVLLQKENQRVHILRKGNMVKK